MQWKKTWESGIQATATDLSVPSEWTDGDGRIDLSGATSVEDAGSGKAGAATTMIGAGIPADGRTGAGSAAELHEAAQKKSPPAESSSLFTIVNPAGETKSAAVRTQTDQADRTAPVVFSSPTQSASGAAIEFSTTADAVELPAFSVSGAAVSTTDTASSVSGMPTGAASTDTSVFMAGSCYIKVVLFESNGGADANLENWSTARIAEVKEQITLGTQWWQNVWDRLGYAGDLSFTIDFDYADNPFSTSYEPITHSATEQYLWIGEYLGTQGYSVSDLSSCYYEAQDYDNELRVANGTDWAFTVFVADSNSDSDGMFSDGSFGYAYLYGPFIHMTYDNDGWGIGNMQMVLAHEMGHIFGALDEYEGNGNSDYNSYSGYYNTQNLNSYDSPNGQVASLMAGSDFQQEAYANLTSSPSSLAMIGWQDSDGDGIIDVLDVPIDGTEVTTAFNSQTGYMHVTGNFEVGILDRASEGNSMTINTVDFLQYRMNGGSWVTVNQTAWKANSYSLSESFRLTTSGQVLVEWRVYDGDKTAYSSIYSETVTVDARLVPHPKSDLDAGGISEVAFQWRRNGVVGYWMNGSDSWKSSNVSLSDGWQIAGMYDMNSDGCADLLVTGQTTINGIWGTYIGYYDGGDMAKWERISALTNARRTDWEMSVGNLTGAMSANSLVWHAPELSALGVWKDGTDEWVSLGGGWDNDWTVVGTGDFSGSGRDEILLSYLDGSSYYTLDIDQTFTALGGSSSSWEVKAIGDFSGDGQEDVIAFNEEIGVLIKWENGKTADWSNLGQIDVDDWFVVGAGDYNGDEVDDLLMRQYSTGMLGYYADGNLSKWNELGRGVSMDWAVIA